MKKKLHHQVMDKAKDWNEKMKKYRFYKEVVKDFLLMIPIIGSVGSMVLNWAYRSYERYTQVAAAAKRRVSSDVEVVIENYPNAIDAFNTGDFIRDIFISWLVIAIVWKIIKKIRTKNEVV